MVVGLRPGAQDIFTVQGDVAQHVTNALAAKRTSVSATGGTEHVREAQGAGTKNLDAYNAYLQGRF